MSKKLFAALSLSVLLAACQGSVTPTPTDDSTVPTDAAMSAPAMDDGTTTSDAMMDASSSDAAMDDTTTPADATDGTQPAAIDAGAAASVTAQ